MAYDIGQIKVSFDGNKYEVKDSFTTSINDEENKNIQYVLSDNNLTISNCLIHQLGVQGMPGTAININDSSNNILIGQTGIFELNLVDTTKINSVKITLPTLPSKDENHISPPLTFYLLVDVIYSGKSE